MQLSQILSASLAAFVLPRTTKFNFYLILLCFGCFAVTMFLFTPKIKEEIAESKKTDDGPNETISQSLAEFFAALKHQDSIYLLPPMALIGVVIAFYANFLGTINKEAVTASTDLDPLSEAFQKHLDQMWGYVLISLALGEICAGFLVGKLADIYNKNRVLHALIIVPEIALVLCLVSHLSKNYEILLVAAFLLGFSDTGINTILGSIIGVYYQGSLELFSIMRSLTGVGCMIGAALSILIPSIAAYLAIIAFILMLSHFIFFAKRVDKSNTSMVPLTTDRETSQNPINLT